jgi:hypothetical protein
MNLSLLYRGLKRSTSSKRPQKQLFHDTSLSETLDFVGFIYATTPFGKTKNLNQG